MTKWLARLSRALVMGLVWAVAWVPGGVLVGILIVGEMEPEWIGGPLYAGFLCGVTFAAVAGIASGRHRLAEMSLPWSAARGAIAGLLGGALWMFVVLASDPPQWLLTGGVVGSLAMLSAVSAVASAFVAKLRTHDAPAHVA